MNSKLSFLLLLSLVLLASCARSPPRPDLYSHALDKIMAPYRNVYAGSVNNVNTHLEKFKSIVQWQSAEKDTNEPALEPFKLEAADVTNSQDLADEDNHDILNDANNRLLAGVNPCQHNGILTDTLVNIFTCNNKTVTEAQFEARVDSGNCQALYNVTRKMCYCSYEFYGDLCEQFNPWVCLLDRLNYPETCAGTDSFDYVYSIDGIPPCYPVADGEEITVNTALACRSTDTGYNFEGVKPSRYQIVQQPDLGSEVFNYVIDGDQVKLTFEPSEFRLEITFSNWNLISQPYVVSTPLTNAQISGDSTINTNITFAAPLTSFASFGRYYYEINLRVGDMDGLDTMLSSNYYYGGYFEKAGYREPLAPNKVNTGLAVGLSILGALVLIAAFFVVRRFRNKKKLATYRERANSLFADDRQD